MKHILLSLTAFLTVSLTAKADGTLPFGDGTLPFDMAGTIVSVGNSAPEQRLNISFQSNQPQSPSLECQLPASRTHNIGGVVTTSDQQRFRISSVCSSQSGRTREVLATSGSQTLRLKGELNDIGRYQTFQGTATIESNGTINKQFRFDVQD